jgi:hypothetical protein
MTAMHPATGYYQLSQDHLADLRHQAQRHALARAACRARPYRPGTRSPNPAGLAYGALTTPAARNS